MDFHRVSLISIGFHGFSLIFIHFSENITSLRVLCGHLWWCWDKNVLPKHVSVARGSVGAHWESPMMPSGNVETS